MHFRAIGTGFEFLTSTDAELRGVQKFKVSKKKIFFQNLKKDTPRAPKMYGLCHCRLSTAIGDGLFQRRLWGGGGGVEEGRERIFCKHFFGGVY